MSIEPTVFSRWLRRLTLLYLGIPVAIFFLGWLRLPLAILMVAVLGWACWRVGWRTRSSLRQAESGPPLHISTVTWVLGAILPAMALVLMSGAGGWGSGDSDWFKHDTILRDLMERAWPVKYQTSAGPVLLVYYMAFYLPAALIGKWTGSWMLASEMLALTMLAGTLLSLTWLAFLGAGTGGDTRDSRIGKGWWWRGAVVFFCFSGLDVFGKIGVNLYLHLPALHGDWNDVEWWAQAFQYPSNAAALFWAPHQAIGAWLPTALLIESLQRFDIGQPESDSPPDGLPALPLALAWVWSPFAAMGLAPIFAAILLRQKKQDALPVLLRTVRSPVNLAAGLIVIVATVYYMARATPFALPAVAIRAAGRSPAPLIEQGLMPFSLLYFVFVLLEFGLLALALWIVFSGTCDVRSKNKLLLIAGTASLLILPLVHYGYANDLVMRGGLPALFVLQILALRAFPIKEKTGTRLACAVVAAVLIAAGTANAFLEYRRHVNRMIRDRSWRDVARDDFATAHAGQPLPIKSLFELQRGIYDRPGFDFAKQYLGSTESFYQRHLAPAQQVPPQPIPE